MALRRTIAIWKPHNSEAIPFGGDFKNPKFKHPLHRIIVCIIIVHNKSHSNIAIAYDHNYTGNLNLHFKRF